MPPKKGGPKEPLQAIVLADSFSPKFRPLTVLKPRCLLPVANVPLIEYTLEFLAKGDVEEVYIMCSSHSDQVEAYIEKSKWMTTESPFEVKVILQPECECVGDVLRDVDARGIVRTDFILVSGDVVSNVELAPALKAHAERRQSKDKNCIMTMVLRQSSAFHRTRTRKSPGLFVVDSTNDRCLRYEQAAAPSDRTTLSLDVEVLEEVSNVGIRNDLIDAHIDICTPDIPALFSENFDYRDLRTDFVRNILISDILGKTIYCHILKSGYAARVENFQTYDAVSKDILSRYTYPLVPDANLLEGQLYTFSKDSIYKSQGVVLAHNCSIEANTIIGPEAIVGEGSVIQQSSIGKNCKIGKNVTIVSSYIWDNAVIEDNVKITNSIVGESAVIGTGSTIEQGSIICSNVVVPDEERVYSESRLGEAELERSVNDSDESSSEEEYDDADSETNSVFSSKSVSRAAVDGLIYELQDFELSDTSIASNEFRRRKQRTYSTITEDSSDNEESFQKEALLSIERSIKEDHEVDVAVLELNTLRMTMNSGYDEVRAAVAIALVGHIQKQIISRKLDVQKAVNSILGRWQQLIERSILDEDDQADFLEKYEEECAKLKDGAKILFLSAVFLYDNDIVDEEKVFKWWNKGSPTSEVRRAVSKWIDWLQNAESESEESE